MKRCFYILKLYFCQENSFRGWIALFESMEEGDRGLGFASLKSLERQGRRHPVAAAGRADENGLTGEFDPLQFFEEV